MKILLINPPQLFSKTQVAAGVTPPLGLLYLSSFLKQEKEEVCFLDAIVEKSDQINDLEIKGGKINYRGMSIQEIVKKIDTDCEIIGISNLFSFAFPIVAKLSEAIKEKFPQAVIIVGGAHPSARPKEVLQNRSIDFVVIGEGELTLKDLVLALKNTRNKFDDIDGLAYKKDGEIFINPRKRYIENLDVLPFPDREAISFEKYYKINEAHGPTQLNWTPILSSRGCPFECTFCTSAIWNRRFRARSAKNVVDEIEKCFKEYNIKEFHFEDENFTLDRKRVWEICDNIIKKGLVIRWQTPNGVRASVTDEETLTRMKEAGLVHITFAPESGSERVLNDIIRKNQDLAQVSRLVKHSRKIGLKSCAYFVLGLPGEKKEDIYLTIKYALKLSRLGLDEAAFSLFIPLPGSFLFEQLKQRGKITDDWQTLACMGDLAKAKSWSEEISDQALAKFRMKAYLSFYFVRAFFHPFEMLKTFVNVFRKKATLKTERVIITFLKRLRY